MTEGRINKTILKWRFFIHYINLRVQGCYTIQGKNNRGGRGGAVISVDVDVVVVGERVSGSGKEAATNDRLLICNGGVDGGGGVLLSI